MSIVELLMVLEESTQKVLTLDNLLRFFGNSSERFFHGVPDQDFLHFIKVLLVAEVLQEERLIFEQCLQILNLCHSVELHYKDLDTWYDILSPRRLVCGRVAKLNDFSSNLNSRVGIRFKNFDASLLDVF